MGPNSNQKRSEIDAGMDMRFMRQKSTKSGGPSEPDRSRIIGEPEGNRRFGAMRGAGGGGGGKASGSTEGYRKDFGLI